MKRRTHTATALVAVLAALIIPAPAYAVDPVRDAQWHLDYLNVTEAHKYSQGNGVTVAVIDTGVDAHHPDLTGRILTGTDLTADGPGDGRIDRAGHGTGMAGLIVAHGRVLGIAPGAQIMPIRIQTQLFSFASARDGIQWAIDRGADVLCLAHGEQDEPDLRQVIERAIAADIVVVAAVGNRPLATRMQYPAGYPGVVAAAGIDKSGNHAEFSITGPEVVLAAPAADIASTDIRTGSKTGYAVSDGTSNATAIIAGAAALVRSKYPDLSAVEVIHRLTSTADDKGAPGRDNEYGYGVVNLVRALTAEVPPLGSTTTPRGPATSQPQPTEAGPPVDDSAMPVLVIGGTVVLLLLAGAATAWHFRGAR